MKKVLSIFLLVLTSVSFGQDFNLIDSMKNELKLKETEKERYFVYLDFMDYTLDVTRDSTTFFHINDLFRQGKDCDMCVYAYMNYIGHFYISKGNYKKALLVYKESARISKNNDRRVYNTAQTWIAQSYLFLKHYDSAIIFINELISYNSDNKENIVDVYNAYFLLGTINKNRGYYLSSLDNFQTADSLSDLLDQTKRNVWIKKTRLYNNTSSLFRSLNDYKKAEIYSKKALASAIKSKRDKELFSAKFTYAILKVYQRKFDSSIIELKEIESFFSEKKYNIRKLSECKLLLGKSYYGLKKYNKAISVLEESLLLFNKTKDSNDISSVYRILGDCEFKTGNNEKGKKQLFRSLDIAISINDLESQIKALNSLSIIASESKKYNKAYLYNIRKDSLNSVFQKSNEKNRVLDREAKYQFSRNENEIDLLKSKNKLTEQQKKSQRNKLIAGIVIASLVGVFLFFLYRNKQKTNEKLREIDSTKSRFFENISHEFRTPLTLIKLPISRALKTKENLTENHLNTIHNNASRLQNLIEDLLSLSELDAGKMKVKITEQNPFKQTSVLSSQFDSYAESAGIKYSKNIENKNITANYDNSVVEKVLSNLISNAIKYSNKGEEVLVEITLETDNLVLKVSDTGNGISKENQNKIFERFYQIEDKDESKQGSGIGLALVKRLLELNNGSISVSSEKGKGSTFIAILPLENIKESPSVFESKTEHIESENIEKEDLISDINISDKPQLLIVEDNQELLNYIKELFENDFLIHTAKNGQKGLEKAIEFVPDIVISDWMMPVMNGIEFCEKVKTNSVTSHIPFLLLTAKAEVKDKIIGYETGADAYFSKPFDFEELQAQINNLISQRKKLVEKYRNSQEEIPTKITSNSQDIKFWEEFKNHLKNHLSNPDLSAESLAKELLMSRMQLHRKLKALTGQTVGVLIKNQRMKLASKLLKDSSVRVTDVWHQVGYSEKSSFSRAFKNEFGVTPGEFKNK